MSNYSKPFWRVDIIISICAMLISLATFVIYFYQTKLIQNQAKASVYPHLEIVREYNNANEPFILYIKNVGIGPAFLKKMEIEYKGKLYVSNDDKSVTMCPTFAFLTKILPFESIPNIANGSTLPIVIPSGERAVFLRLNSKNPEAIELLRGIFDNARMKVCYSSVYKEYWVVEKWKQPIECDNCENETLFKPTIK